MKKTLTEKQREFVKLYAEGKSATQAYKQAYNCKDKKDPLVAYHANKLLRDELVIKEIEEKRIKSSSFLNYKTEDSFNKIKEIQEKALEKGDLTNALKAEEMAGKLAGLFKQNDGQTIGILGDFKEFYAAICAKKDYGNAKKEEKGQELPKNEISVDSSKTIDA